MLDEDFCTYLEYAIGAALLKSPNTYIRRCWCDGIRMPGSENDYSRKTVNDERQIITKAWIDEGITKGNPNSRQYLYDLTLKFGKYSLRRYAGGSRFEDCIPDTENPDWIDLDIENKIIVVQLL